MSGEVVHFEVPADDVKRARKFYAGAFGWKMNPMPEMSYTMVQTTESSEEGRPKQPGSINGGLMARNPMIKTPVITIMVDEISAAEKTIVKHGGKIVGKKTPIGDGAMGFTGYFTDPEGNLIGLYQAGKPPA